jgi:hypothetical protein
MPTKAQFKRMNDQDAAKPRRFKSATIAGYPEGKCVVAP